MNRQAPMPELLAPAGGMEQLKTALRYGADAVYGGLQQFGLRAAAANFTPETLTQATAEAHRRGKRFYVTLNLLPFDRDLENYVQTARAAADAGADAAIVSDLGAALALCEQVPQLPIHVSTQANVLNSRTALHWANATRAERIVLSREMSLEDIRIMRQNLPETVRLEAFVHGAMCVAYSGRCLLSAALTGRSANRGECAQSCRWHYAVAEEKRPGQWMPLVDTERGSALFSAYDLCMLPHLPEMLAAGISSLKIEGRMKTAYYVATVVSAYRRALDTLFHAGEAAYREALPTLTDELNKGSHRASNTGFYFASPQPAAGAEGFEQTMEFVGQATRNAKPGEPAEILLKNRFYAGDTLEVLSPDGSHAFTAEPFTLVETGETLNTYSVAGTKILMRIPFPVSEGDFLRGPNRNHL
ncbi:MAG TPA: U32 family peptidase [Candidatus Limiplasma sp.]|nr:U32 family peptidase [Candidatus Limiplasma sp.]